MNGHTPKDFTLAELFSLLGPGVLWVIHAYLVVQMVDYEDGGEEKETLFKIDEQIMRSISKRRHMGVETNNDVEDLKLSAFLVEASKTTEKEMAQDYYLLQQILNSVYVVEINETFQSTN